MKPEVISKLKAGLRGPVILPEDQDYNEAPKVYNGMIDKHPSMIVECADAADVRLAVAFARENDFRTESSVQDTDWTELTIGRGDELRAAERAGAWFPLHRSFRFRFHGFSRP